MIRPSRGWVSPSSYIYFPVRYPCGSATSAGRVSGFGPMLAKSGFRGQFSGALSWVVRRTYMYELHVVISRKIPGCRPEPDPPAGLPLDHRCWWRTSARTAPRPVLIKFPTPTQQDSCYTELCSILPRPHTATASTQTPRKKLPTLVEGRGWSRGVGRGAAHPN